MQSSEVFRFHTQEETKQLAAEQLSHYVLPRDLCPLYYLSMSPLENKRCPSCGHVLSILSHPTAVLLVYKFPNLFPICLNQVCKDLII